MAETVLVAVAWPYANSALHAGQIAGAYLPADIFARYHRMRGNRTLMVSGSDSHGTPVTIRAEQEGLTPEQVFERTHASFLDTFERFGISFDLFTSTNTANHAEVAQDMFLRLHERGHIYEAEMTMLYDTAVERFLPDRYVEGTCPHCGDTGARGDQCDNCGRTMDALELINPRSRLSESVPEPRQTNHFFLKLSAFNDQLMEWVEQQQHWRPAVRNFTLGLLREGLHDRAITRDIAWGVPVPLEGYEGKRIYVWFEAVIGYLSATKEWAQASGEPDAWEAFWANPEAKTVYFQGKDNIPFHTTIWPAMLLGYGGLNLPVRRAGEPVRHDVRLEGVVVAQLGDLDAGLPRPPRPRPAALLAGGDDARDRRHRLHVGRVPAAQQRRAGRALGQPREPRGEPDRSPLRGARAAATRRARGVLAGDARRASTPPSPRSASRSRRCTCGQRCRRRCRSRRRRTATSTSARRGRP